MTETPYSSIVYYYMYNAPTEIVESKLEVVLGQKRCTKPKDGRLQSSKRLPSHATLAPAAPRHTQTVQ